MTLLEVFLPWVAINRLRRKLAAREHEVLVLERALDEYRGAQINPPVSGGPVNNDNPDNGAPQNDAPLTS